MRFNRFSFRMATLVSFLASVLLSRNLYAEDRVAVVDTAAALLATRDAQIAKQQLMVLFREAQSHLDQRSAEVRAQRTQLAAGRSRTASRAQIEAYQTSLEQLQNEFQTLQRRINDAESHVAQVIQQRLIAEVRRMRIERRLDFVFERGAVVAYDASKIVVDLTDELVNRYNTAHPTFDPSLLPSVTP